ncbi:MAG: heavy-metal-associated domain-containing protein [Chloroflexota bacterium]|nr:heavy-metal-associated domain-containing protein [Chloroflexota bacterium]
MLKTIIFAVKGMTCENCVRHVTEAIKAVPGVQAAEVSLAAHSATVDGDFDERKVVEAVEEEGYEASVTA